MNHEMHTKRFSRSYRSDKTMIQKVGTKVNQKMWVMTVCGNEGTIRSREEGNVSLNL